MVNLLRLSRINLLRLAYTPSPNILWAFVWLRVLPLTFLTLVALIPAQYYITEDKFDLLMVLAIILFLPRPILVLRTMVTAIGTVHDEMRANRWDVLILTGIPARKIVWRKWVVVVKQTAFDHFVFSLFHVGLALGVAEYMNVMEYLRTPYEWSNIFSMYRYNGGLFYDAQVYPSVTTFMIGSVVIALLGLLECGLVASIGLTAAFAMKRLSFFTYILSSGFIIGLKTAVYLTWILLWVISGWSSYTSIFCYPKTFYCGYDHFKNYSRVNETLKSALFASIDQGTLLSANIMRPLDDRMLELKSYEPMRQTRLYKSTYDNRPFVLRNLLAAVMSIVITTFFIRSFLHRATRFAVINHGASGYLEL